MKFYFFSNWKSIFGIASIISREKGKKTFTSFNRWKGKIFFFLKSWDLETVFSDLGIQQQRRCFFSRTWKELELPIEISYLFHDFSVEPKPSLTQMSTHLFVRARFNILSTNSTGSGKYFSIILSSVYFCWLFNTLKNPNHKNESEILIILETIESKVQLLKIQNLFCIFLGLIGKKTSHCREKINEFHFPISIQIFKPFLKSKKDTPGLQEKFKLLISESLFFTQNKYFDKKFLNYLVMKNSKKKQIFFLSELKAFCENVYDFSFIIRWDFSSLFFDKTFSHINLEICKNSYSKLGVFIKILPKLTRKVLVLTKSRFLSIFLSRIINNQIKKKRQYIKNINQINKGIPNLKHFSSDIVVGTFISALSLLNMESYDIIFYEPPLSVDFWNKGSFHQYVRKKEYNLLIFLLLNSQKIFFKEKIKNWLKTR